MNEGDPVLASDAIGIRWRSVGQLFGHDEVGTAAECRVPERDIPLIPRLIGTENLISLRCPKTHVSTTARGGLAWIVRTLFPGASALPCG